MRHNLFIFSVALLGATSANSQILNKLPSRVLGHPNPETSVTSLSPNLVEGKEMWSPQGIAIDTTSSPPIVYVSDTLNNRVLGWKNAISFANAAKADIVIGQNDFFTTLGQGPAGNGLITGFITPTGLTIDSAGSLYVVDSGNNRILRFPAPFAQKQSPVVPDLVIGQANFTGRSPNYDRSGATQVTAAGIFTTDGTNVFQTGLAFDSSGNLWFADPGNARVLRFPKANIPAPNVSNSTGGIKADLVIGQPTLTTTNDKALGGANATQIKNQFGIISDVKFDAAGRLFVVDDFSDSTTASGRVLVFANPNALPAGNGSADRIMGVVPTTATTGLTPAQSQLLFGQTTFAQPSGIFFLPDNSVAVMDTLESRILIFPPYDKWDAETKSYSPLATSVIGQGGSFLNVGPNASTTALLTPPASGNTFWDPTVAVYLSSTNELFVADQLNNRVIVMPFSGGTFQSATRVLGQTDTHHNSPNLIEGREFQFLSDAAIALDTTGKVPHLYIADTNNHRVLGYYDARTVTAGKAADLVIGQPDFATAICNYNAAAPNGFGGDGTQPTQSSLCGPSGLVVDAGGSLYVADTRNGRVLRFTAPFANYPKVNTLQPAELVLGQQGFTAQLRQASQNNMGSPYGLAISGTNGLLVSDPAFHRVLFFAFSANGTFTAGVDNFRAATKVFGQPDFISKTSGTSTSSLNTPLGIATDADGKFYVAEPANNRVSVFADPISNSSGAQSSLTITGLGAPRGVAISSRAEIWITNTTNATLVRYSKLDDLVAGVPPNFIIPAVTRTLALTTDPNGALYVADASNRIAIYYQALQAMNGANFIPTRPLSPGLIASICSSGSNCNGGDSLFPGDPVTNSQIPVPNVLADVQVFVNGTLSPLFYVSGQQINFQVPGNAPTGGLANIEVVQKSTGLVLAAGQAQMNSVSPGIFASFTGTQRQAAVINEDGTINGPTTPAQRGHLIQIYASGPGVYPGFPADGAPPTSLTVIPKSLTQVLIGPCLMGEGAAQPGTACPTQPGDVQPGSSGSWIPFSGLSPQFPGLWQVNAQIPMAIVPSAPAIVKVLINGTPSSDTGSFSTIIYVK